jgi:hypothetical protein
VVVFFRRNLEVMEITDRQALVGVFSAIGALAKKLTGESLSVKVTDGDGSFTWVDLGLAESTWAKPEAAQTGRPDPPAG